MTDHEHPVLIIDGSNLFIRSFAAYPQMTSDGEQFGGCIGFLKTMRRLVSEMHPSRVYVVWESGGSSRRRALYSEYKMNRKPEKLNRFYEDDIPESDENRKFQMVQLLAMLKCIPVCQLYVPDCEGDDVISYLCCGPLKGHQKIIASSDKDFYQLLDEKTKIYSLHKKIYVVDRDVFKEFRVLSKNFAIAKALCGDTSDNIPGIKGMGFKTVAKLFPFLGTDERAILLQDVIDYSHSHVDESKMYTRIVEHEDDLKRNWRLVFLNGNMLSAQQSSKIDNLIATYTPKNNKVTLMKMLAKFGVSDIDVVDYFSAFNCIQ